MATRWKITTSLSLVLLSGACSTRPDHPAALPDDLKQDLAAAASSSGDFATAPQSYQPMRFVSAAERPRTAAPTRRIAVAHRRVKARHSTQPAPEVASETPDPMSTMVAEAPAPASSPEPAPAEPVVIAHQPTAEPAPAPTTATAGSGGEIGGGSHGRGGGWGGILGGLIGAAVIRGGIGTVDKCDPRTDGRRPTIIDRQDIGLPPGMGQLPGMGQPTFPGRRRR